MTRLLGHDAAEATLLRAFQAHRLHHGWLLAGPEGIGKRSFAREAAAHLLTRAPDFAAAHFDPDETGVAGRLLANDLHPDCHYLTLEPRDDKEARKAEKGEPFDLARNIKVDQIRSLHRRLTVRPSMAERRVIIIDSADMLERNAANALLKNLEEPPENTIFLLLAHNPGRLLPTIRSRCLVLHFMALDDAAMTAALKSAQPALDTAEITALVRLGQGAPGQALRFAGLDMAKIDQILMSIARSGDHDHQLRLRLGALVNGKANRDRFRALLHYAPRFAATVIRTLRDDRIPLAIAACEEMDQLAARAIILNLDAQAVAFQIGGLLARLAPPR
ncbi:AAA family ATPase [Blastomonas sp.]|uniref:AAA family ATPase n=1 Tax=Blastomonas sp. TaxID=1909299 RepID=UPI0035931D96